MTADINELYKRIVELQEEINRTKERLDRAEKDLGQSKADRKKIREALKRLVQQEKAARGQINLGEIIDILKDDDGGQE
jgi:septal ring factor EnvC (AmiA/AmiB activator)